VVFAERNWHVYRHHDRMVREGRFVYIKNNMPQLVQFNSPRAILHRPETIEGSTAATDLVEGFWEGTLSKPQAFIVTAPYPAEVLFDVEKDPYQVHNLADDPQYAEPLQRMRGLLAQWTRQTGDTVPALDQMTPDRNDRHTGKSIQKRGRPPGGIAPGDETRAWEIHHPGPIKTASTEDGPRE
jgi:N-sulfoglucosamine sulfohydrolase